MVVLNPPSSSRSTSEMTLSFALKYRIVAFSSKLCCRSQLNVPCSLMNPKQNILCLLKYYDGPVVHLILFCLGLHVCILERLSDVGTSCNTDQLAIFIQFRLKQIIISHLDAKSSRSFGNALQMKPLHQLLNT